VKELANRSAYQIQYVIVIISNLVFNLKVCCLHPVACTRSGSGFPSNATLLLEYFIQ
jgi:NADH:ubiquinone oxidoreductase subunit 3 (subunit A)